MGLRAEDFYGLNTEEVLIDIADIPLTKFEIRRDIGSGISAPSRASVEDTVKKEINALM